MASTSFSKPPYSKSQSQLQPQSQSHSSSQRSSSAQRCYTQPFPHHNSFPRSASHPTSPGHTRQDERNFIAHYGERGETVPPERIEHDPVSRKLGFSSKKLRIDDFELMKTLGTGILRRQNWRHIDAEISHRHLRKSLVDTSGESET
jgi:hypothetical protein